MAMTMSTKASMVVRTTRPLRLNVRCVQYHNPEQFTPLCRLPDIIRRFNVKTSYPPRFSGVIDQVDDKLLQELDFIACMYKKPLSHSSKIHLRNKIFELVQTNHTREEVLLFDYILNDHDCFNTPL